jgi:hypothetical protein
MIEPPLGDYEGLPALRRFAAEVATWPGEIEDWRWCARFNYQVIERRGTGGGNFRHLYAGFLAEAGAEGRAELKTGAELAAEASERWTSLAGALLEASESQRPEVSSWQRVGERASAVLEVEERLWAELGRVAQRAASAGTSSRAK